MSFISNSTALLRQLNSKIKRSDAVERALKGGLKNYCLNINAETFR